MKRYVPTCVVALLLVTVLAMPGHAEEPAAQVPAAASQPSSLTTDLCQLGEDQSAGVIDDAVRSATRYGLM